MLVTCSTEYQNDGRLIQVALAALADRPVRVVATTASLDPASLDAPPNARVARFLPHGPVAPRPGHWQAPCTHTWVPDWAPGKVR